MYQSTKAVSPAAKFDVPVFSFTPISTPGKGHKVFRAVVNVNDLPDLAGWRKVNVRDPRSSGAIPKALTASLHDESRQFLYRNQGMVVAVDHVKPTNGAVEVTLSDPQVHGLLDGGHTYATILRERETLETPQFVQVEFLEGFEKADIAEIIESRNTSTQVKIQSLMNFSGEFEPIKSALAAESYADAIAYKEFELNADGAAKRIDVREIVTVLTCFDSVSFPGTDEAAHPIVAYRSKSGVLAHLAAHVREMKPFIPHLPTMLRLYETIQADFVARHSGTIKSLPGIVKFAKDRRPTGRFTGLGLGHRVPLGYVLPVLAAFRAMLPAGKGSSPATWTRDPFAAWRGPLGRALVAAVAAGAKETKSANAVGKSNLTWQRCYDLAHASRKGDVATDAMEAAA